MLKIFMAQSEARGAEAVPVHAVAPVDMERFLAARPPAQARWLKTVGFAGRDGDLVLVPGESEKLAAVILGL
jgi:hypothetical protein